MGATNNYVCFIKMFQNCVHSSHGFWKRKGQYSAGEVLTCLDAGRNSYILNVSMSTCNPKSDDSFIVKHYRVNHGKSELLFLNLEA